MHVVEICVLFEVGEGFIWRDKDSVDEEVEQFAGYDVIKFCETLEEVVDARLERCNVHVKCEDGNGADHWV